MLYHKMFLKKSNKNLVYEVYARNRVFLRLKKLTFTKQAFINFRKSACQNDTAEEEEKRPDVSIGAIDPGTALPIQGIYFMIY